MSKALTGKQERFVAEYMVDLNATQAAVRAGYAEKVAYRQGYFRRQGRSGMGVAKRDAILVDDDRMSGGWNALRKTAEGHPATVLKCHVCKGEKQTDSHSNSDRYLPSVESLSP